MNPTADMSISLTEYSELFELLATHRWGLIENHRHLQEAFSEQAAKDIRQSIERHEQRLNELVAEVQAAKVDPRSILDLNTSFTWRELTEQFRFKLKLYKNLSAQMRQMKKANEGDGWLYRLYEAREQLYISLLTKTRPAFRQMAVKTVLRKFLGQSFITSK